MSQGKNLSIRDAVAAVADGVAERLARAEDGAPAHEPEAVIRKFFWPPEYYDADLRNNQFNST